MMTVDVNVVTFNSSEHLPALLASLAAQEIGASRIHLHVVDNASEDDTLERLAELLATYSGRFAGVTVERSEINLGFGRAHNQAAAAGDSPYLFILNPDAELAPDCLRLLLTRAEASEETVAAWEPRQVPYEHPKAYDPVTLETPWASGAALLIRRSAFREVEGFEPRIFLYCEDVDLSWRLRAKGYRLQYVPQAVVHHRTYTTPGEVKPVQYRYSLLGDQYLRARFGTMPDVASGLLRYMVALLRGNRACPGARAGLWRNIPVLLRDFRYFRDSQWRRKADAPRFVPRYAVTREGAYHPVTPSAALPSHPRVSVLVRTMGRVPLLRRALTTVAHQTYPNIEVVLVQDGPGTLQPLLSEFPQLNVRYIALGASQGRCHAGNAALAAATGEYCVFLDEDDEFYADHIEQLVAEVLRSHARVSYSLAFEVETEFGPDGDVAAVGRYRTVFNRPFSRLWLYHENYLPILTVLFQRSLFAECGGFDPELDNQEDWDLWVRYSTRSGPFAFVPKTTALYRVPLQQDDAAARYERLVHYRELARRKHAGYGIDLTVGELAGEFSQLLTEAPYLAADRDAMGALYGFFHGRPRLRRLLRGAQGLYRRLVG